MCLLIEVYTCTLVKAQCKEMLEKNTVNSLMNIFVTSTCTLHICPQASSWKGGVLEKVASAKHGAKKVFISIGRTVLIAVFKGSIHSERLLFYLQHRQNVPAHIHIVQRKQSQMQTQSLTVKGPQRLKVVFCYVQYGNQAV